MRLCCCFFLHLDSFVPPGLQQLCSQGGRALEKGVVDILHGVGLMPLKWMGRCSVALVKQDQVKLNLGLWFCGGDHFVVVFSSQEIIQFGLGIINKPLY